MAQFDVYKNPSQTTKRAYPFIVDIQNSLLDDIATRIVVPLGSTDEFIKREIRNLTPEVKYNGKIYLLAIPQIASVPNSILKKPHGTLIQYRNEIISALDFAITGF
jgi:toxin CcdB